VRVCCRGERAAAGGVGQFFEHEDSRRFQQRDQDASEEHSPQRDELRVKREFQVHKF
jgi:hypothetical protein